MNQNEDDGEEHGMPGDDEDDDDEDIDLDNIDYE